LRQQAVFQFGRDIGGLRFRQVIADRVQIAFNQFHDDGSLFSSIRFDGDGNGLRYPQRVALHASIAFNPFHDGESFFGSI
jgi:hypothetical protein